ncbi:protein of unknown function [Moritella yayanosii]|uniref:Uncharacterized protein n=1 Tax=Moritella yayanosii TaxID=69539 RepID=A0A330LWB2_9GAMM|nr:protein of unknown function [Moritella yayanosii]
MVIIELNTGKRLKVNIHKVLFT